MSKVDKVFIGTSGWQYSHWGGNFYPSDLPQKDWLKFYAKHFDTVEVNSSFYRQTRASTFEKWKSEVPDDFIFSIKGNRYITHIKRLKDCEESVKSFFDSAKTLLTNHESLITNHHVILWQLPPSFKKNPERVEKFLGTLPRNFRLAFEFRHESWTIDFLKEFFKSIKKLETAVVLQDWRDWPIYDEPIGDFVYIRFHGREQLYTSGYSDDELASWAKKMQEWISCGLDVYAYFNNDALGYAVENALKLKELTL